MEKRPIAERETLSRIWLESRGLGSSRLQIFAFGASVAAHALAILLYTSISAILQPDTFSLPIETDRPSEQRTPLIRLIDIIPEDLERPEEPEDLAEIEAGEANAQRPEIEGILLGDLLPPPNNAAASGTCKRNETNTTKRNQTKRNETKRTTGEDTYARALCTPRTDYPDHPFRFVRFVSFSFCFDRSKTAPKHSNWEAP